MLENWKCITAPTQSFAGLPVCTQLNELEADIAIIGLHYISPYPPRLPAATAKSAVETAPDATGGNRRFLLIIWIITILISTVFF